MADGPALSLQKGLIAALKANPVIAALVGAKVYDEPPDAVVLPYIRVGSMELSRVAMDGDKDWEIIFGIEAHSRPTAGRVEATKIAEAIAVALDETETTITVTGFNLEWVYHLTQSVSRDSDGKSYTAVVAFKAALSD